VNPDAPGRVVNELGYPTEYKRVNNDDPPEEHFWNDVNGVNFLTNIRTQFLPSYCNSGYALAATSAISDRIKIMRNA